MLEPHAPIHPCRVVYRACSGFLFNDERSQPVDRFLTRPVSVLSHHEHGETPGAVPDPIERGDPILNTVKGARIGRVPMLRRPLFTKVIDAIPEPVQRLWQVSGVKLKSGPPLLTGKLHDSPRAEVAIASALRIAGCDKVAAAPRAEFRTHSTKSRQRRAVLARRRHEFDARRSGDGNITRTRCLFRCRTRLGCENDLHRFCSIQCRRTPFAHDHRVVHRCRRRPINSHARRKTVCPDPATYFLDKETTISIPSERHVLDIGERSTGLSYPKERRFIHDCFTIPVNRMA